jgi:hypothetical protein
MRILAPLLLLVAVAAAALLIDDGRPQAQPRPQAEAPQPAPEPTARPDVAPAHCPAGVEGCHSVLGSVLYVESVDPDGDGDLHVVVLDGSVTLPGVTAVDVAPELRPARDPRPGDRVSAAGPVQRGSHGQSQIHALEFHTQRR